MTIPSAVQITGYSPDLGLIIAIVLGPAGLAHVASGQLTAIDLAHQGLPRGKVVIGFATDPRAIADKLQRGDFGALAEIVTSSSEPVRSWRCPACNFVLADREGDDAFDGGLCPNDFIPLEVVSA